MPFSNTAKMSQLIPIIREYDADLEKQNLWWSVVSMVGKVNNQNMDGQLLDSIATTQTQFEKLRTNLIENMVLRYLDKVSVNLKLRSQAFINTLNRNLFERTADVGFLAQDQDIVSFLEAQDFSAEKVDALKLRLHAYVQKYSVYDDVVILTKDAQVVARIDETVALSKSNHSIWQQVIAQEGYLEYDLPLDILPNQTLPLSYLHRICNAKGQVLGILCLSFKFKDELTQLSQTLSQSKASGEYTENFVLSRSDQQIIFAQHPELLKINLSQLTVNALELISLNGRQYFAYASKTDGYQGFKGQPWLSIVLQPLHLAFQRNVQSLDIQLNEKSALFPQDLNELNLEVNTALLIVVLNGKIISLKNQVKAFLPVLDSFQEIGEEIRQIFSSSIAHIYQITHQTLAAEVSFLAKLAMDIMDRNLYERANDCRWWALNAQFRSCLSDNKTLSTTQREDLNKTLKTINALYTVYQQLVIFDKEGTLVAMSNEKDSSLLGKNFVNSSGLKTVLKAQTAQEYCVSPFEKSPFYDQKSTYLYYAAISKPAAHKVENVGCVAVVFDAEPEFKAILMDFLPKDSQGHRLAGSFAAFMDAQSRVISITDNPFNFEIGSVLNVGKYLDNATQPNGSFEMEIQRLTYLVGYQISQGYREYKITDGYQNKVTALIFSRS